MKSVLSDGKAVAPKKVCLTFLEAFEKKLISSASFEFAKEKGFTVFSPVQNAVIPLALQQPKDLLIEACTGSGKTLAYLVPTVEILLRSLQTKTCAKSYCCCVGALLLAPTRELASQIQTVLREYLKCVNKTVDGVRKRSLISSLLFVGGSNIDRDLSIFRDTKKQWENYTVLVATPGRLCALVEQLQLNKDWHVANLQVLVFDEADRLLMERVSFETQLGCILKILPKQRRTFLVSATLSHELITLLKAGIKNPLLVRVEAFEPPYSLVQSPQDPHDDTTPPHHLKLSHNDAHHHVLPENLTNFYCLLHRHSKLAFLLKFLVHHVFPPYQAQGEETQEGKKCIIFFLTCAYARHIHKLFQKLKQENHFLKKTSLLCLYGKMSQKSRMVATKRFHNADDRNACILLATDIAARGLDFPNVSWIIQYDPPTDPTMFVHRIGRTARAGKKGQSLLFLCPSEEAYITFLENREVMIRDLALHPEKIVTRLLSYTDDLKNIFKLKKVSCDYKEAMEEFSLNFPDLHHSNESTVLEIPIDDLQWTWKICRAFLLSDQALIRSAAEAIVSFIRAYKENHLQYIFVFKDLEIGELASSLGMLRLPRVKEILAKCIKNFHQSCIDPKTIPFKDPIQQDIFEKRNQKKLEEFEKKKKKQLTVKKEPLLKKRTRSDQRRATKTRLLQDLQELRRDENLFKKLKRGKITLAKYDQLYEKELGGKIV